MIGAHLPTMYSSRIEQQDPFSGLTLKEFKLSHKWEIGYNRTAHLSVFGSSGEASGKAVGRCARLHGRAGLSCRLEFLQAGEHARQKTWDEKKKAQAVSGP